MGWSIGFDVNWGRDIGYGVPAICDHPECNTEINRGLAHVCCDNQPYGGERGCGLYFCRDHLTSTEEHVNICPRCIRGNLSFVPKPDCEDWIGWKLSDESWAQWRKENPEWVKQHVT